MNPGAPCTQVSVPKVAESVWLTPVAGVGLGTLILVIGGVQPPVETATRKGAELKPALSVAVTSNRYVPAAVAAKLRVFVVCPAVLTLAPAGCETRRQLKVSPCETGLDPQEPPLTVSRSTALAVSTTVEPGAGWASL